MVFFGLIQALQDRLRIREKILIAFAGLLLIICVPEISLTLPRLAGLIR